MATNDHDNYAAWAAGLTEHTIASLFHSRGCDTVVCKLLASNDNTKNQIYLGMDLTELSLIPSGEIETRLGSSSKPAGGGSSIFWAPMDFSWITPAGRTPAPDAKLIYYPQYPEVRASGLLRGSSGAPNALLDPTRLGRSPGRVLLLGSSSSSSAVHALLLPADVPAANHFRSIEMQPYGVLGIWDPAPISGLRGAADPRSVLLAELQRVHDLGWIASCRLTRAGRVDYVAPNGAGFTLEAELGVLPNGDAAPDFLGWEVKQHGVGSLERPAHGRITLMTPEPDGGVYASDGVVEFVSRWGHPGRNPRDRLDFAGTHRFGTVNDRTGLELVLDGYEPHTGRLDSSGAIALIDRTGQHAASWSFAKLLNHWKRKHAAAVYVPSEKRSAPDGSVAYRFGSEVLLGEGTSFERLLGGITSGSIRYDPGIHIDRRPDGSWSSKKRNQFRVGSSHESLQPLYRNMEAVRLARPGQTTR